jgi:hypothetical protein
MTEPKKKNHNGSRAAHMYLDHDLYNVMERLKTEGGFDNRGAVLRRAVALLDIVTEYRAKGYRVYLRDCREFERELKFANDEKVKA